jgi:transposase
LVRPGTRGTRTRHPASKVLATIADPRRFDTAKQIIRTAGYDLCADRSGKSSDQAVPVISKKGNSQLRYALYQAAKMLVIAWTLMKRGESFNPEYLNVQ